MNGADVIPLMTHSYGKYWKQPATSEIEIEERYAVMGKETFEKLLDYSCSIPSGAYEGKMWRRENGAYDLEFVQGVGNQSGGFVGMMSATSRIAFLCSIG